MQFSLHVHEFRFGAAYIEMLVPDAVVVKEAYQKGEIVFPYWSQVWPAAKALANFLTKNPAYTKAKNVVELGAGLGLPSLVAASNARRVLCTDYVPDAVAIAKQSADRMGLQNFVAEVMDWQHLSFRPEADVLLLSDINYEPAAFALQRETINSFLEDGTVVLLSTPQRLMAKDFIAPLLPFCERQEEMEVEHDGKTEITTVLVLRIK